MTALQSGDAAFLEALNAAHHPLALYPPQQIRTDSFSQAFFDYLRAIDRLLSMPSLLQQRSDLQAQLPRGAFSGCPICALVPGVPQDGCNKPSSYAGVAKAFCDLEQHTDTYLDRSGLEGAVQQLHDSGQLILLRHAACGMACDMLHLYIDFACQFQVDSDMAQLQLRGVRGPHEQRMAAAKLKCMELETAHALEKEKHHGSAEGESPLIARGWLLLVEGQVSMYRTQVEQLTNDVHELGLQRDRMGQSDKDTRAASNAIKAKLRLSFSKRQHSTRR
ncbi:hypothetical protein QJQ45_023022 [Haematococcus lacustris]|nr:hypothetical protein QJQ45_023022 [Haematococcus lacustris]